jgi:flagellar basal-body rod modification protein FlgD
MEITAAPAAPTSLHSTATAATGAKKTLDKEVFLALLVAQLRNQDPTAPMDTTDMMAQSTQLASMEQLTSMADTSRESFALQMRIAALGLVGQEVTYLDQSGNPQQGVVEEVSFAFDVPMVRVGDHTVPLDAVAGARTATPPAPAVPGPQTDQGATDGTAPPATDGDPAAPDTPVTAAQPPQGAGSDPTT